MNAISVMVLLCSELVFYFILGILRIYDDEELF